MNASSRRTLRLGITAGLSLGAIVGLVGCADQAEPVQVDESNGVSFNGLSWNGVSFNGVSFNGVSFNGVSFNGLSWNGLSWNGLSWNGVSFNGVSFNGVSFNGLESSTPLSTTSGLMTTEGGREFVKYMVRLAYPNGASLTTRDQYNNPYTFQGGLGIAPQVETGTCDPGCQEALTGAMLAHINNSGLHVNIWLDGPDSGVGWGSDPSYPYQEGVYFGNMFAANMPSYYCAGRDLSAGDAMGRLGSPWGNNNGVLTSPYGWQWDGVNSQNVPVYCSNAGNVYCTQQNEGFSSCSDPYGGSTHPRWYHPVTVYRNFESSMLYKICNKYGKCLGVIGGSTAAGADVEQRAYSAAAGQTWQILQVSPGNYKIINKTSGMALTATGSTVEQQAYTGASNQIMPMNYISADRGFANVKASSNTAAIFMAASNASGDGVAVVATTAYPADSGSPDGGKWSFTAIGPGTIDPGRSYRLVPQHATGMSIDVAYGSTSNGTPVQQYSSWNGDPQKLFVADAGKGRVKLTMKLNRNKCIGPVGGSMAVGTMMEVQDCNGSNSQAWITGETTAGSGVFMMKNVANANMCLDVAGSSGAAGARMDLWTCTGANNQLFGAQVAP
jgi:hypothetical protein